MVQQPSPVHQHKNKHTNSTANFRELQVHTSRSLCCKAIESNRSRTIKCHLYDSYNVRKLYHHSRSTKQ